MVRIGLRVSVVFVWLFIGCHDNKTDELAQRVAKLEAFAGATGDLQKRVTSLEEATKKAADTTKANEDAQKNAEAAKKADEAQMLRGKKVTIRDNQTGAEACAAEQLDCMGVSSTEATDSNNKTCGYFVPDCFTRMVKKQCGIAGGKFAPYTFAPGKFALITSDKPKGAISSMCDPGSNYICSDTPSYSHAICVGF